MVKSIRGSMIEDYSLTIVLLQAFSVFTCRDCSGFWVRRFRNGLCKWAVVRTRRAPSFFRLSHWTQTAGIDASLL